MMPSDGDALGEAIDYVQSVAPIGGAKLRKFLSGLLGSHQKREILEICTQPENYYSSWPNWKPAARAWMLTALVRDNHWGYGFWQDPGKGVIQGYVDSLKTKYKPDIDQDIKDCFSFGPGLKSLETLQESDKRKLWGLGNFTNPTEHKDSNFRYIAYAMVAETGMPFMKDEKDSRSDYIKSKFEAYISKSKSDWTLACAELYLDNPSILTTELLSCSVISNEHKKTYRSSSFGFILSVPYQNVCVASSSDLAIDNSQGRSDTMAGMGRPERMMTVSSAVDSIMSLYRADLKSPQEILAECVKSNGHNELVLVGSISGLCIRPSGIFIKITEDGFLWASFAGDDERFDLKKHIKACAVNHNIPIVSIKDSSGTASEIVFTEWVK